MSKKRRVTSAQSHDLPTPESRTEVTFGSFRTRTFYFSRVARFFLKLNPYHFSKDPKTPEIFLIIFSFLQGVFQMISDFLGFHGCAHVYMCFYIGFHRVSCIPTICPWSWLGNSQAPDVVQKSFPKALKGIIIWRWFLRPPFSDWGSEVTFGRFGDHTFF